jgi:hypothetical protein
MFKGTEMDQTVCLLETISFALLDGIKFSVPPTFCMHFFRLCYTSHVSHAPLFGHLDNIGKMHQI